MDHLVAAYEKVGDLTVKVTNKDERIKLQLVDSEGHKWARLRVSNNNHDRLFPFDPPLDGSTYNLDFNAKFKYTQLSLSSSNGILHSVKATSDVTMLCYARLLAALVLHLHSDAVLLDQLVGFGQELFAYKEMGFEFNFHKFPVGTSRPKTLVADLTIRLGDVKPWASYHPHMQVDSQLE